MADPIAVIERIVPPATLYVQMDYIVGTSTPAESVPVFDFAGVSTEYLDFYCRLSADYTGRGLSVDLVWACDSATGGNQVRWQAMIRRIVDDAEDLNTTVFDYATNAVGVSADVPSAIGEVSYDSILFAAGGAEMDGLLAGEAFILRVWRPWDHADDDPADDANLHKLTIRER